MSAAYKPGDFVPKTGIYRVYHDSHRLMHEATLLEQTRFPRCHRCSDNVSFELARAVSASLVLPFRSNAFLQEYHEQHQEPLGMLA